MRRCDWLQNSRFRTSSVFKAEILENRFGLANHSAVFHLVHQITEFRQITVWIQWIAPTTFVSWTDHLLYIGEGYKTPTEGL